MCVRTIILRYVGKNMATKPEAEVIDSDDNRIHVRFTPKIGTLTGWPESAEDFDLLGPGPKQHDGVEVVSEEQVEDGRAYSELVLAFDDAETMRRKSSKLFDQATKRFEWGASGAEDVQQFAAAIPSRHEVEA